MNAFGHSVSRRRFIRLATVGGGVLASGLLAACSNTPTGDGSPSIKILYPVQGAHVDGTRVSIQAEVKNWQLVKANQPAQPSQGHLHLFIDVPASSVAVGQVIPTDKPQQYVHMGAPPFGSRTIELAPGVHTVTVVMGDSLHGMLDNPAPASVTFVVG